ncbi:MAG: hypothetical protein C5B50_12450 [Verrucomicrobia bacterium]|nr:MAG: hypothetical protein C5B50_12450 [Verrucomicrobiota bacterium]
MREEDAVWQASKLSSNKSGAMRRTPNASRSRTRSHVAKRLKCAAFPRFGFLRQQIPHLLCFDCADLYVTSTWFSAEWGGSS